MRYLRIIWDDYDNPKGNVQHIADHGLTIEDGEYVLENLVRESSSSSTGRPCTFGYTLGGDYIIVVYERDDDDWIYPVTAYEIPET